MKGKICVAIGAAAMGLVFTSSQTIAAEPVPTLVGSPFFTAELALAPTIPAEGEVADPELAPAAGTAAPQIGIDEPVTDQVTPLEEPALQPSSEVPVEPEVPVDPIEPGDPVEPTPKPITPPTLEPTEPVTIPAPTEPKDTEISPDDMRKTNSQGRGSFVIRLPHVEQIPAEVRTPDNAGAVGTSVQHPTELAQTGLEHSVLPMFGATLVAISLLGFALPAARRRATARA